MRLKHAWVAFIALAIFGCDDNTGSLGLGMLPDSDQNMTGHLKTFDVITQSELDEKVFAQTSIGYVGRYTDPDFGFYEAGFLAQLHCTDGMTFPEVYDADTNPTGVMTGDSIYLAEIVLSYSSYFGDSLTTSRMNIYELNKELNAKEALYTDIDPTKYFDASSGLLAEKAYSPVNLAIKDSIRNLKNFYPYVRAELPKSLGTRIYEACREAGPEGLSNKKFQEIFQGIYVKNTHGDGSVLFVDQIELNIAFEVFVKDSTNTKVLKKKHKEEDEEFFKDSTAYGKRTFVATKEIIQANQFNSDKNILEQRQQEKEWTYLKTPAGIYTQAVLPLKEMESQLSKDTINAVKLAFTTYNQSNNDKYMFKMNTPKTVLLIREQDRKEFFEKNKLADEVTSFLSQHSVMSTNQYVFSNITKLISACLAEKKEARTLAGDSWNEAQWLSENPNWDKVALIPVLISYDDPTSDRPNVISVQNDLRPGYAKLKGGAYGFDSTSKDDAYEKYKLKMEVIYTSFGAQ